MTSKLHICLVVLIVQFIACHACHKGYRWEHRKGAAICVECDVNTFMSEDNHSNTDCFPCTNLTDADTEFYFKECNKTEDAVIKCKSGLFRIENKCKEWEAASDDLNKISNNTDQNYTEPSESAVYEIFNMLLIIGTIYLIVLFIGLLFVQCRTGRSKWLMTLMEKLMGFLSDKQHFLDMCLFSVISALAVCCLVTLIVKKVYPVGWIFIVIMFLVAFCVVALLAIAILSMLQRQHFSWKAGQEYANPLLNSFSSRGAPEAQGLVIIV